MVTATAAETALITSSAALAAESPAGTHSPSFSLFRSISLSLSLSFLGVAVPPPGARRPRNVRRTGTVVWSRPIRAGRRTSRVFCEWAFFLVERGPIAGNEMNRKPRGCPFFFRFATVARWSWLHITPSSLSSRKSPSGGEPRTVDVERAGGTRCAGPSGT